MLMWGVKRRRSAQSQVHSCGPLGHQPVWSSPSCAMNSCRRERLRRRGKVEYRELVEAGESRAQKTAGRIKALAEHRLSDRGQSSRHEKESGAVEISLRADHQASMDDYGAATREVIEWEKKYPALEANGGAPPKHAREPDRAAHSVGDQGSMIIGGTRGGHEIKRPGPGRCYPWRGEGTIDTTPRPPPGEEREDATTARLEVQCGARARRRHPGKGDA